MGKFIELQKLIAAADYSRARAQLSLVDRGELAHAWPSFKPMDKLVLFKLMDVVMAWEFFARLGFSEKYFLLCGFPLSTIAPVLEGAPAQQRRCFVALPSRIRESMLRLLVRESEQSALAGSR